MLDVTTQRWALTIGLIVGLLALDLGVFHRKAHEVSVKEALVWTGVWVEKSLSVDNLFVFVIIMTTFAVPKIHQQKVLIFGIGMALVMRVAFIALGAALLELFSFMFLIFGLVLVVTAVQLYRHRDLDPDVADNGVVRLARRALNVTDGYDGGRLFTRNAGRRAVTPLFIVLLAIGSTDLLFALDSIPAIFGVTDETYIVIAANAFALLGLRPLFFLVKGLLDRLVYLSTGLALILAFIGVKLVLHWGHGVSDGVPQISTTVSLVVIVVVLTVTTVASILKVRRDPGTRAHAGSLTGRDSADRPTEVDTDRPV